MSTLVMPLSRLSEQTRNIRQTEVDKYSGKEWYKLCYTMHSLFSETEMKSIIFNMIIANIQRIISITQDAIKIDELYNENLLHHASVFNWTLEKFMGRISHTGQRGGQTDLLRFENPKQVCLIKFFTDLINLERLLNDYKTKDVCYVNEKLIGCQELLSLHEQLDKDYKMNKLKLEVLVKTCHKFDLNETKQLRAATNHVYNRIQDLLDQDLVTDSIIKRYTRDFQLVHHANLENKYIQAQNDIQDYVDNYREHIERDKWAFSSVMDYYRYENQVLRSKLNYWSRKYDDNYDKYDNKLSYTRINLKAFNDTVEEYKQQLESFRAALKQHYEMELRLKQEEEERRLQELLEEEALKKRKKKGKKSSRKNTGRSGKSQK